MNVLFVCTGNTCRSPLAEAAARSLAPRVGLEGCAFASAGTDVWVEGGPASPEAVAAGSARGLDLSGHRSRTLTADLVEWADVVLALAADHRDAAEALGGGGKTELLAGGEIEDPWSRGPDAYRRTADAVEAAIRAHLPGLAVTR